MIKAILILFVAIIIVLITGRYLLDVEATYLALLSDNKEHHEFTHEFKEFTLINTGADGKRESVIYSPQTYLDTTHQVTTMETPRIEMAGGTGSPVDIRANTAEVFHQKGITLLEGDVLVRVMNDQNIVVSTEKLTLDHNQQLASTNLQATVIHDKGKMRSTGLEYRLSTNQVKFLANVRGTYEQ